MLITAAQLRAADALLVAGGPAWSADKLVIPFLAFCYVIGSVVHVHHIQPTIRWWPRREWTKFRGQMEGTTILRVTPGLNFFIHWIMPAKPPGGGMTLPPPPA